METATVTAATRKPSHIPESYHRRARAADHAVARAALATNDPILARLMAEKHRYLAGLSLFLGSTWERRHAAARLAVWTARALELEGRSEVVLCAPADLLSPLRAVVVVRGSRQEEVYRLAGWKAAA